MNQRVLGNVYMYGSMCACPEPDMKKVKVIKMRNLTRIRSLSLDNQQLQLHECMKVYWNSKYVNLNTRVVLKYPNKKVLRKINTILLLVLTLFNISYITLRFDQKLQQYFLINNMVVLKYAKKGLHNINLISISVLILLNKSYIKVCFDRNLQWYF